MNEKLAEAASFGRGMNFFSWAIILFLAMGVPARTVAQSQASFRGMLTARDRSLTPAPPAHLQTYVKDGKISLTLRDAILLTLENSSSIVVQETQIETQKFNLLAAFQSFDPYISSQLNLNRYSTPTYSQLQGVGTSTSAALNTLSQAGWASYTQTFTPGTNFVATISSSRSSTNSAYNYFNPYYSSTLNFQFTQPLFRNGGRFANTALIHIARRSLQQSRASFEAQVNDDVLQAINQYWLVVQARATLDVRQKSYHLAELSYDHDKRALDLGALSPLDIYRSQAEVASRKVTVIQAENSLSQASDALRVLIGADQDPSYRALDLDLTEKPEPQGELENVVLNSALDEALNRRPEMSAEQDALAKDEIGIRLAHNQLKPSLSLSGFYQSSGLGGNQYDLTTGKLLVPGGFGASYDQVFGFGYPGYGGSLTLQLPVKNRASQAALGNALVGRTRDLYYDRLLREQITQQVSDAVQQLDETKMALQAGTASYDLAQKSLAADQRKYELGAETNFFVLDSQSRLAEAELTLLQTEIEYQVAVASVHHAIGSLLDSYRVQIAELSR